MHNCQAELSFVVTECLLHGGIERSCAKHACAVCVCGNVIGMTVNELKVIRSGHGEDALKCAQQCFLVNIVPVFTNLGSCLCQKIHATGDVIAEIFLSPPLHASNNHTPLCIGLCACCRNIGAAVVVQCIAANAPKNRNYGVIAANLISK